MYESPDANGETRREYNARFGVDSPEIEIHPDAQYLCDLFEALSNFHDQGFNGPLPLQPGTILDWCLSTGNRLLRQEIEIMYRADAAYRRAYYEEQARQYELSKENNKSNPDG